MRSLRAQVRVLEQALVVAAAAAAAPAPAPGGGGVAGAHDALGS